MKHMFDKMGVLVGWKSIASYMHLSISTVKRLEKTYGLPIITLCTGRRIALKEELDAYVVLIDRNVRENRAKSKKS